MKPATWLPTLLLVFASTLASAQPAAAPDLVAKGQALFDDQRYEDSIQTLSAALLRPDNTKEQKVEIYRLLALDYITLGRKDEADSAVRGVLVAQPDYQLPANESPRFRDFFQAARAKWEAEGRPGLVVEAPPVRPVVLRHGSPSTADKNTPVDLLAKLEDPDHRTARVVLYWRSGSEDAFHEERADVRGAVVKAQIPAAAARPPLVEYYFEAFDKESKLLTSRGDAQAPLRISIAEGSRSPWLLPLVIGGAVLGAAAVFGGLALAGVFDGSGADGSGKTTTVRVNVGEAGIRW